MSAGPLVVCDLVYAELAASFEREEELTDAFLFLAGRMWRPCPRAGRPARGVSSDVTVEPL